MQRKTGGFFLLFVFASLVFSGCFSPWKGKEATLTLVLGNTAGRTAAVPDQETLSFLEYIIELNGPTGRQSHTVKTNTFSVTVMPGYWNISVRALLNTTLYAQYEGGAEIKAEQNNHVEIKMETVISDKIIFVTNDLDDGQGSLRYALGSNSDATIMVMLPQGSEIKLENLLNISSNVNLTIEGNGITLSKSDATWSANSIRLMTITETPREIIIRRVHFKGSNNLGAIQNLKTLSLESCIFSNNNSTTSGGAVSNAGTMYVKGCTFYNNTAARGGGAISTNGSRMEMTGNLFFMNTTPVIYNFNATSGGTVFCDYNAVDAELGTGDDQSGWEPGSEDITFTGLDISGDPINTETFKPLPALDSIVPKDLEGFPTTDFYGNKRSSGAPGAVN